MFHIHMSGGCKSLPLASGLYNARHVNFLQRLNLNPEQNIEIDLKADDIQVPNRLVGEPVAEADQPEDISVDNCSSLLNSTEDEAPQVFPVSTLPGRASPQQLSWRLPEEMRQRLCDESLSEEDDTSATQPTIKIPQIFTLPVSSASTH